MTEKLIEKKCIDFVEVLASRAPVPGGGGVAALTGACGAALCSMVGNLTVGRKKYIAVESSVKKNIKKCKELQDEFLILIDQDAAVFEPLSKAYSISKDDPDRECVLENATIRACQAPLRMMQVSCETIEALEEMLEKGSVTLVSDVGCGALNCAAALEGAGLNVFVNTKMLKNRKLAAEMDAKADSLLDAYLPRARKIADETIRRLR